jgi:anti-sigma factor ChrR (cupin superfamily)
MSEPMSDTNRPSPDELAELAALLAAGALSADEAARFEHWLAQASSEDRHQADAYMPVVEQLGSLVAPCEPPETVKQSLLARIAEQKQDMARKTLYAPLTEGSEATTKPAFKIQRADDAQWFSPAPGQSIRMLAIDRAQRRFTALVRLEAGAHYPAHHHAGTEECYVLEGDLRCGNAVLRAGDFQRAASNSWHEEQWSEQGCVCLIVAPLELLESRR